MVGPMDCAWLRLPACLFLVGCFDPEGAGDAETDGDATTTGGMTAAMTMSTTSASTTDPSTSTDPTTPTDTGDPTTTTTDPTGTSSSSTGTPPPAAAMDDEYYWVQGTEALEVDGAEGLLANDSPAGDVSVTSADLSSLRGGDVSTEPGGGFTYDAPGNFWGYDTFSYTIEDDAGNESMATVTVWVRPIVAPVDDFPTHEAGFSFIGDAGDLVGGDVRTVGDWDGDDIEDLGIVANHTNLYGEGSSGSDNEGPVYILLGGEYDGDPEPSDLENNQGGFAISPTVTSNGDPATVVGGDWNGDGMGDLAITTPFYNLLGRAWVILGDQSTTSFNIESWDYDADGFIINNFNSGLVPLASVGDFTGDGSDELAYSGCRTILGADSVDGWTGADLPAGTGFTVSGLGTCYAEELADVNGDGDPELLMFAYDDPPDAFAYVLWSNGAQGDTTFADIVDDDAGYYIFDSGLGAFFGDWDWVSGGGDVNGDGRGDILINAENIIAVGYGKDETGDQNAVDFHGGLDGFRINTTARGGGAARIIGDMNGDGQADIAITDPSSSQIYVLYGSEAAQRDLPETDGDGLDGFIIDGATLGVRLRTTSGDWNGDGLADLAVGAQDSFVDDRGAVYVVYGVRTGPPPE